MRGSPKAFILRVIAKFRQHECLWRTNHKDYGNKAAKNRALDNFLRIFRTRDPTATRLTVHRKLQELVGEYERFRRSKANPGTGNAHKLWYYKHLSFLEDQDLLPQLGKGGALSHTGQESSSYRTEVAPPTTDSSSRLSSGTKADAILERIADRLAAAPPPPPPCCCGARPHETFGRYVAEKLRSVPASMVPYCQKLINEAIFLAEIGSLDVTSRITADEEAERPSTPASQASETYSIVEEKFLVIKQEVEEHP